MSTFSRKPARSNDKITYVMKRVQEVLTLSLGHEELWFGPCNESVFKGAAIGGSAGDRRGKNIMFSISIKHCLHFYR